MNKLKDSWNEGDPYEYFMGRWSKLVAREFLAWLKVPENLTWLDIGCGTGVLGEAIFTYSKPKQLFSIDPSEGFLARAKARLNGKGEFMLGHVSELPFENDVFNIVVSGLALNFFEDISSSLAEMKRVSKSNGLISAYVWDYSGRIDLLRYFWDTVISIDPQSHHLDEGVRFPICNSENLEKAFIKAGLTDVTVTTLDIVTVFNDFEDYWNPFLGGQGPAPSYLASLSEDSKEELRNRIFNKLPIESNGLIKLLGRAIAIKGKSKEINNFT